MEIFAPTTTGYGVQADRALYYGRWLLLGLVVASLTVSFLAPTAPWLAFSPWAVLCGVAARRGHMLAWTALCLIPLALISLLWIADLDNEDPFGIRWAYIYGFVGASMVTAATGILALLPRDEPRSHLNAQGLNQA